MKKYLLMILPFVVSCSTDIGNHETSKSDNSELSVAYEEDVSSDDEYVEEKPLPPVKIKNEYCMDMERFKVFQVFESGAALASHCEKTDYDFCYGKTVLLTPQRGVDYYDDMIVTAPENKCAVQDGVYRYENREGIIKTVPIIRWLYKYRPSSEEEALEQLKEYMDDLIDECQRSRSFNKTEDAKKKCECIVKEKFMAFKEKKNVSMDEIEKRCTTENKQDKKKTLKTKKKPIKTKKSR